MSRALVNSAADAQLNASGASLAAGEQRLKDAETAASGSNNATKDKELLTRVAKMAEAGAKKIAAAKAKEAADKKAAQGDGFSPEEIATAEDAESMAVQEDDRVAPAPAQVQSAQKQNATASFHVE